MIGDLVLTLTIHCPPPQVNNEFPCGGEQLQVSELYYAYGDSAWIAQFNMTSTGIVLNVGGYHRWNPQYQCSTGSGSH